MPDQDDDVFSAAFADHKRLAAERFRRIWQLVEDIASQPGKSRKELASQFALGERQQEIFAALAEALLRKSYVKLIYPAGEPVASMQEPIVRPEVLFPYCSSWHLIGTCRQRGRMMVFDLDNVVAVSNAVGV